MVLWQFMYIDQRGPTVIRTQFKATQHSTSISNVIPLKIHPRIRREESAKLLARARVHNATTPEYILFRYPILKKQYFHNINCWDPRRWQDWKYPCCWTHFLANTEFAHRLNHDLPLNNQYNWAELYSEVPIGYIDYLFTEGVEA
ncbi:hypothetical protein BJV82DRAFT_655844 [Fennellomyces sp. T-0311]|nr:hypothetical protein BJV82DRAFT_655844 [Fennellomyces sp. T-0311]